MFAQLVSDARDAEYEHVDPADHDRLFYNKPWWQRVIIMASGVVINLVIAFVLFAIAFMGYGIYTPTTTVRGGVGVRDRRDQGQRGQAAARAARPRIRRPRPRRPASRPGTGSSPSTGHRSTAGPQAQREIRANDDRQAVVVVERDGKEITLRPKTTVTTQATDPENRERITEVGFLGVVPTEVRERQGLGFVVTTMADGTWETMKTIAALPQKVYHVGLRSRRRRGARPERPDERGGRRAGRR